MRIMGYVRTVKTGNPVPDNTEVEIRRHVDNSLVATVVTVGGLYEYVQDGSPGPYYVRVDIADEVHISSSQVVGMSGPIDIGSLPLYFRLWTDGYINGILDELKVFAAGAAMQVSVRAGVALVKGVLYDQGGVVNLPVDAPDAQPRIDTVVVEVMVPGSGRDVEGRTRLVVKKGTPAASPVPPSLTQTTTIWEYPLADVRVDTGVSAIASNKVTARSAPAATYIAPDSVDNTHILDGTIVKKNIQIETIDSSLIKNGSIEEMDLAPHLVEKINANSYNAGVAKFIWSPQSSTSFVDIYSVFAEIPKGRWLLYLTFDGQVASQTAGTLTEVELKFAGNATAGMVSTNTTSDVEAKDVAQSVSFIRFFAISQVATGNRILTLQSRRVSGANYKLRGHIGLHLIQLGPLQ